MLNHWIKSGLIEDERPEGKGWHKFSASDIIWIKIMTKLRGFGLSIKDLQKVKEHIEIARNSKSQRPLLEFYVAYTRAVKKPARVLVFPGGEALISSQIEIDTALHFGGIVDDFISIDINRLLDENPARIDYLNYTKSDIEKTLFNDLHDPKIKKIIIESRDAKYEVKSTQLMDNKDAALAARQLLKFGMLEEQIHNGKSNFTLTKSTQLDKPWCKPSQEKKPIQMANNQAISTWNTFMLSIEKCHQILNTADKSYSKEEARIIRDCLYILADLSVTEFTSKDNGNNH